MLQKWILAPELCFTLGRTNQHQSASITFMRPPCDNAIIRSGAGGVTCVAEARLWILVATILASSMAFIDSTVVNVALPAIQSRFHATVVDVQWVVESYGLFLGALILVGGSLGDLFGRRLVFVAGVALFALASSGCGVAMTIHQLILARSIQGVGAALLVPGSLAIISTSFDEKSRGQAIGTWSGFTAITTAVGPVLGGWLVEHASWRWAFFINVPLAAAVTAISVWRIPESRSDSTTGVDWAGALFASLGLSGLVYGFIESTNRGWGHPLVSGSVVIGFGCLVGFTFVESRVTSPMVPLTLFESRSFTGANLLTLFLYSAIGIFFFLFPLNLIQVQGYSATAAGAAVLPLILLIFLLSRWSGGLVGALWRESSIDCRPHYCGVRLRSVRCALHWRRLLDGLLPSSGCSGIRVGDYGGASHHSCYEFRGPRPCRHGFGNQQCSCPSRGCACYCSLRGCNGGRLCFSPESQPVIPLAAAQRSARGSRGGDQTGRIASPRWPESRYERRHKEIDWEFICIWISNHHVDLRKPVRDKRYGRVGRDSKP